MIFSETASHPASSAGQAFPDHAMAPPIWRLIFLVSVEWLAPIRPHVPAVDARNDCHGTGWPGVFRGQQGRPVLCAGTIAHRLSIGILVEGVKRHASLVDQRPALRRFGRPERLCRYGR